MHDVAYIQRGSVFHSIQSRVTLFLLAIFLAGIWALAFYASRILREEMQHLLGDVQQSTAAMLADSIDEALENRMRALELVAGGIDSSMIEDPAALQRFGSPGISVGFDSGRRRTDLMGALHPQTPHRSPRQAFGGNLNALENEAAGLVEIRHERLGIFCAGPWS
jgi:hypothetical protein